jgi:hypothetical protein
MTEYENILEGLIVDEQDMKEEIEYALSKDVMNKRGKKDE